MLFPDACGFTASDDNRLSPARLIKADAGGAAAITGTPATGRVEELSPPDAVDLGPLAVGPGSSGDVDVDDDDPSPELLSDEPEEVVSARR